MAKKRRRRGGLYLYQNLKKSPNFYVKGTLKFWHNNQEKEIKVEQSTYTDNETEAGGILHQIRQSIIEMNTTGKEPSPLFGDIADAYIASGGEDRFLDKIMKAYEYVPISDLDQIRIDQDARRVYPDAANSTIRRQWHGPISQVIHYHDPNRRIKRPSDGASRTDFLTPAQGEKLIEVFSKPRWPNPWSEAIILMLLGQGVRTGELFGIDGKDDVFIDYGFITLRDTKNSEERNIPLQPRVIAALKNLPNLGAPGPLFRKFDGQPYRDRKNRGGQIKTAFSTTVKSIGLDPSRFTPHICRHTWATWYYSVTLDIKRLMAIGGWKQESMVHRYVKLANRSMAQEVRNCGWGFDDEETGFRGLRVAK